MSSNTATKFQPEDMQLLAWKFLDGCASAAEQQELAGCLTEHEAARAIYLQCVQLHVDLLSHFDNLSAPQAIAKEIAKPLAPLPMPAVVPLPMMNVPSPI